MAEPKAFERKKARITAEKAGEESFTFEGIERETSTGRLTSREDVTLSSAELTVINQTRRTGAGTADSPLTDIQIQDLLDQGISEGDVVPGKGVLGPRGVFRTEIRTQLEKARRTGVDIQRQIDQLGANQITADTGIVDTDAIVQGEVETSAAVATAAGPDFTAREEASDRILDLLEKQARQLEIDAKVEFADIERRFQEAKGETEKAQVRETGTFQVGLARIGGFLGESASAAGALVNLAGEHRAEINVLRAKRDSAINAARRAQQTGQFEIAQLRLEEIKSLEEDIDKRRQDFFDNVLALQREERLSRVDPFFTSASIVSLMKEIPVGAELNIVDPNTGELLNIIGIRSGNEKIKTIQSTDARGNVTVTSYLLTAEGIQLLDQQSVGLIGKPQQAPISVTFPRQSRTALFDAQNNQVGFQVFNPITAEVRNFDLEGNEITFPEGGRLGTFSQGFEGGGLSNEDLAGG